MTLSSTMNMAAENGDDPPGVLQSPTESRHHSRRFEVERVRAYRNLKWRMVRENSNRFAGLGIDHVNQMPDPLAAKATLVAARAQGIQRDQSYRKVVNRIINKVGTGRKISACQKRLAQFRPVVAIAGQDIDRSTRLPEYGHGLSVFVSPSVMNDIPGVNDHIGDRIECVYIRDREFEIPYSLLGIGAIDD